MKKIFLLLFVVSSLAPVWREPPEEQERGDKFCKECTVDCEYINETKENNRSANPTKCSDPHIEDIVTENIQKCGFVDSRCRATVRCYPKPAFFGAGGNFGVDFPAFEVSAECPLVDGKCPENPKDCMKNNDIRIAIGNYVDMQDREELFDEATRRIQNRGGGVR